MPFKHTARLPDTVGVAKTVNETTRWQPLLLVYVILTVPGDTPVNSPVALTVAIEVLEDTQGLLAAAVAVPVNWDELPTHTFNVPVTVGKAFTVNETIRWQPLLLV